MVIKLLIVLSFLSLNLFSDIRVKEPIHYSGEKLGLGLDKDYKVSKDFFDFSKNKNLSTSKDKGEYLIFGSRENLSYGLEINSNFIDRNRRNNESFYGMYDWYSLEEHPAFYHLENNCVQIRYELRVKDKNSNRGINPFPQGHYLPRMIKRENVLADICLKKVDFLHKDKTIVKKAKIKSLTSDFETEVNIEVVPKVNKNYRKQGDIKYLGTPTNWSVFKLKAYDKLILVDTSLIKNIYFKDFRIAIDKTSRESVSYKILPFEENERILEQERVTNAFEEIRKAEEERQLALEAEMKAQIEEEKRIAAEKKLKEQERLAEQKRLRDERLAETKRKEEERLAEEKRIEEEKRIALEEAYYQELIDRCLNFGFTGYSNISACSQREAKSDKELAIQEERLALLTLSQEQTNLRLIKIEIKNKELELKLEQAKEERNRLRELERTREREIKELARLQKKKEKEIVYINTSMEEKKERKTLADVFLNVFLDLPKIYLEAKEQARKEKRINTMINNAVRRARLNPYPPQRAKSIYPYKN